MSDDGIQTIDFTKYAREGKLVKAEIKTEGGTDDEPESPFEVVDRVKKYFLEEEGKDTQVVNVTVLVLTEHGPAIFIDEKNADFSKLVFVLEVSKHIALNAMLED